MLSFLQFLSEALSPIPGKDKGFEALHDLGDGHKIYLQIGHTGGGSHKVRAVYIPPGGEIDHTTGEPKAKVKGSFFRFAMGKLPSHLRTAATSRVFADVKHFIHHNDWNKLYFGGSDRENMAMYRRVMGKMADQSGGKYRYEPIIGAGAKLIRNQPIEAPKSSGIVPPSNSDHIAPYRKGIGLPGKSWSNRSSGSSSDFSFSNSSRSNSGRSVEDSLEASSGHKSAPSGLKGPSGPKGSKKGDDGLFLASGASSSSSDS